MSKRHQQLKRDRYYHARDFGFCLNPKCFECRGEGKHISEGPDVCWCGVKNPYYADIHETCGGLGMLNCICGGDQCVCHNHGEVECFGCADCEDSFDEFEEEGYYDHD